MLGNVPQGVPTHRVKLPVRGEEADHALRLLERLNQSVQQYAIKATVMPSNAVPVVFEEQVHERPPDQHQGMLLMPRALSTDQRRRDIKGKALG